MVTRQEIGFIGVLLAAFCGLAPAQNAARNDALPPALQGIQPALGMCRGDEDAPKNTSARGPVRAEVAPDLACALPVAELPGALKRPDTLLVDMRPASEHSEFRIDGALNLSAPELRNKPYLRDRNIVLIGSGKGEREIYAACAELKQSGFRHVRTLRGGMTAWLAHGQPVVGRPPEAHQAMRLSAPELWREAQFDGNVVLLADKQEAMLPDLPFSAALGYGSPEIIRTALEQRRRNLKDAPFASVVLVVDASASPEELRRLQRSLMPAPLLVYTGSREALTRHIAVQKAMWAAQARGPKQPGCRS